MQQNRSSLIVQHCGALPLHHKAMHATKTYGHELGFSCAFRQWRAASHCNKVHGYAIGIKLVFAAEELDECGWVIDFGNMKGLKAAFADLFDHKTLVAFDDPHIALYQHAHSEGVMDVILVPGVGCEAFSRMSYKITSDWLSAAQLSQRVHLVSVEVMEHGANSAICYG